MSVHTGPGYRHTVAELLANGRRFAGLHATADGRFVRLAHTGANGDLALETVAARDGAVPTVVDLIPAAGWDEREAHDLYGVGFDGHEPLRPLVDHDLALDHWTVPVRGHDPYQVAVGPIHAGVIESGHFRFHVVGDRILHLDPRLFYKHRGLEQAAVGTSLQSGAAFVGRACAACAVSNGIAYAQSCESALGLTPPRQLARVRTILLELERCWSHLNDIAAVCAGVGLAAGTSRFLALSEQMRRLNATLTGHRYLFGTIKIGGSPLTIDTAAVRSTRDELETVRAEAARAWRELVFNASFEDRLPDIGIVTADDANQLGTVGPAARAAGLPEDARVGAAHLVYDGFEIATLDRPAGDVQARIEQRAVELEQSFTILHMLLDSPVRPTSTRNEAAKAEIGVSRVESPRGATLCVIERSSDRLERVRLRTGSYANWPSVAFAATDNLLPDFPLINKSFELCYACADR